MADVKTTEQIKKEHDAAEAKRKHDEANRQHALESKHTDKRAGGATVGGAMTTYGQPKPHMPEPEPVALSSDEVHHLAGDIQRGEVAHIRLDEHGNPTGAAFREVPKPDEVTAPVYGSPMVQFEELVTPSGAPITKHMNPEPKLWDAGMLARNPIPEPTERQKEFHPQGGGVVNQPVTV